MEGISVTHIDFFKLVPTVYRRLGEKSLPTLDTENFAPLDREDIERLPITPKYPKNGIPTSAFYQVI